MKKLFAFLLTAGILSTASAQQHQDRNDNAYGNNKAIAKSGTSFSMRERDEQVQKINREFDQQIQEIRRDRRMRSNEKSRRISQLEKQRAQQINQIEDRYSKSRNGSYDGYAKNNRRY